MNVVLTAFPVPEHRAEVIIAFEAAIARVHHERALSSTRCTRAPAG
jgi:hypothetical protein